MRILVADDEATSRLILSSHLRMNGNEVISVVNGAEAWEELQKPNAPMLAIIDWQMPEMDGLEVIKKVRSNECDRNIYTMIVSGRGETDDIFSGILAGADDYICKPIDADDLLTKVWIAKSVIELHQEFSIPRGGASQVFQQPRTMEYIMPICPFCKIVRNNEVTIEMVFDYIQTHPDCQFNRYLCEACAQIASTEHREVSQTFGN